MSVPFFESQPKVLWGIYNETCRWWYMEPLYPPREEGRGPAMVLQLGVSMSPEITILLHKSIDTFAAAILFYCKFWLFENFTRV